MRHPLPAALSVVAITAAAIALPLAAQQAVRPSPRAPIEAAVKGPARTPANVARDRYRHPVETLSFFAVKPTDTVVEFIPGGGWYTEILAPLTRGKGRYVALVPAASVERTRTALAAKEAQLGRLEVAGLDAAAGTTTLPPASADVVLTFRNVHNLMMGDNPGAAAGAFRAFHAALKPGGRLGVVDHRLPEEMDGAAEKTSGYIKRSTVLRLAQAAGFRLIGESRVNANPRDTHVHPEGVWTLPPVLRLKDQDRAKYEAIGESDRMTLLFVKPAR